MIAKYKRNKITQCSLKVRLTGFNVQIKIIFWQILLFYVILTLLTNRL